MALPLSPGENTSISPLRVSPGSYSRACAARRAPCSQSLAPPLPVFVNTTPASSQIACCCSATVVVVSMPASWASSVSSWPPRSLSLHHVRRGGRFVARPIRCRYLTRPAPPLPPLLLRSPAPLASCLQSPPSLSGSTSTEAPRPLAHQSPTSLSCIAFPLSHLSSLISSLCSLLFTLSLIAFFCTLPSSLSTSPNLSFSSRYELALTAPLERWPADWVAEAARASSTWFLSLPLYSLPFQLSSKSHLPYLSLLLLSTPLSSFYSIPSLILHSSLTLYFYSPLPKHNTYPLPPLLSRPSRRDRRAHVRVLSLAVLHVPLQRLSARRAAPPPRRHPPTERAWIVPEIGSTFAGGGPNGLARTQRAPARSFVSTRPTSAHRHSARKQEG